MISWRLRGLREIESHGPFILIEYWNSSQGAEAQFEKWALESKSHLNSWFGRADGACVMIQSQCWMWLAQQTAGPSVNINNNQTRQPIAMTTDWRHVYSRWPKRHRATPSISLSLSLSRSLVCLPSFPTVRFNVAIRLVVNSSQVDRLINQQITVDLPLIRVNW